MSPERPSQEEEKAIAALIELQIDEAIESKHEIHEIDLTDQD